MQEGTYFDVTDPRDRVYAIYGIITSPTSRQYVEDRSDIKPENLPINYSKSTSQVYQDLVKYLINTDRNLDALAIFESRRWHAEDLPSWVTDWREHQPRAFWDVEPDTAGGKCRLAKIKDIYDHGRLSLRGFIVGSPAELVTGIDQSRPRINSLAVVGQHSEPESFSKIVASSGYLFCSIVDCNVFAPRTTTFDDISVVLEGGKFPFVLRELRSGTFKFIGPVIIPAIRFSYTIFPRSFCGFDQAGSPVWPADDSEMRDFTII